jgi:quercetin dioxygenase-like cupin family protein
MSVSGIEISGRKISVLGDEVEILVSTRQGGGVCSVIKQSCGPGGGSRLHVHEFEDETFYVLEGSFEFQRGEERIGATAGEVVFGPHGIPHSFKNVGASAASVMCVATPGGLDLYLEEISRLSMPPDAAKLETISIRYGIKFLP